LEIPEQLKKDALADYVQDGTVADIIYYSGKKLDIRALLKDVDKRRYYAKVAPLHLLEQKSSASSKGFLGKLFGKPTTTSSYYLQKRGPWSRQALAGAQYWADEQEPTVKVKLIRNINGETKGE
jgi:hypothetical protein